ncbi:MAG: Ldh family oxidoreductase [Spirochaetia bacterium]
MGDVSGKVRVEALESFCVRAMTKAGLSEGDARTSADVLVTTDTWGVHTHGTKQLRPLLKNFRDGKMDLRASAELVSEGPSWAIFDGRRSMPMVTSTMAMRKAMEKAQVSGIAYVAVRNSGHFGAAGYYAMMAAREGMVGVSMCNVDPCVAVPGSKTPVLGTNPLAYAAPAGQEKPVFLDIATSVAAASKIFAAKALGKTIPEGWLLDAEGVPTTDPRGYPQAGALLPMAGHKGYGIAMMIEILTGVLAGGAFGGDVTSWVNGPQPVNQSFSFIAIDIGAFMPIEAFGRRMDKLIREIRGAPKARGTERIYLPGEKEWENRERALQSGLALPADVVANLKGAAEDYGLDIGDLFRGDAP